MGSLDKGQRGINHKTSEAILDTAKTIYMEEIERFKQIEVKAQIAMAVNGVLIGVFITYLVNQFELTSSQNIDVSLYSFLFKIVILLTLIISILLFLHSIKSETYHQLSLKNIVKYSFSREDAGKVMMELAATYKEAIDENKESLLRKFWLYDRGMILLQSSIVIFTIFIIVEELTKYV